MSTETPGPQITTDDDGRHWHQGREYVAVYVDGELDYQPKETQPDPQVEPDEDPRRDALRCIECEFRADDSPGGWYDLSDHRRQTGHRHEHVKPAPKPLTVADIPAGQGAASLFIGHGRYGELAVMYRTGLTHDHVFMTKGPDDPSEARRAMWDHLAATLPTVTTEED